MDGRKLVEEKPRRSEREPKEVLPCATVMVPSVCAVGQEQRQEEDKNKGVDNDEMRDKETCQKHRNKSQKQTSRAGRVSRKVYPIDEAMRT